MIDILKAATPIDYINEYLGAGIYIKRDDMIPFSYGGNKVRIAAELIRDMKIRGFDSIISYGSAGSNMNRAVAELAGREGIPCRVIIKREDTVNRSIKADISADIENGLHITEKRCVEDKNEAAEDMPLNERLVHLSGAIVSYCEANAESIKKAAELAVSEEKALGRRPYYIYGNSSGQGNRKALMLASFKEYGEIRQFEKEAGISFSHIFLAVGTGATISGLVSGERTEITADNKRDVDTPRIHGISVARDEEKEREIILDNLYGFNPAVMDTDTDGFDISDEYLCGGYGLYNEEIADIIEDMYRKYKIPLDPTYTGKAFYGMKEEIRKNGYTGNCLFIHTGGYPLFEDFMKKRQLHK